jgi:hypothetical protein
MARRKWIVGAFLAGCCSLALAGSAWAIRITLFTDTDTFIQRAKDIVIVEVTGATVSNTGKFHDGLYSVDVELIKTLKGDKAKGKTVLATIYPTEHAKRYLVSSLGGSALGTDLLAVPELSLVALSDGLKLEEIEGKPLQDQIRLIFEKRLEDVVVAQKQLAIERRLLERATGMKHDE